MIPCTWKPRRSAHKPPAGQKLDRLGQNPPGGQALPEAMHCAAGS